MGISDTEPSLAKHSSLKSWKVMSKKYQKQAEVKREGVKLSQNDNFK